MDQPGADICHHLCNVIIGEPMAEMFKFESLLVIIFSGNVKLNWIKVCHLEKQLFLVKDIIILV